MISWQDFFKREMKEKYYQDLMNFLEQERQEKNIYPAREDLFSCFELCPYEQVKAVIIGQDPYHQPNQAHGLSFSVKPGVRIPPSLRNIYKELKNDLGLEAPKHGYLADWARQGVLMMNSSWSVEEGKPGSHKKIGWKNFTEQILQVLNKHEKPLVFVLWGNHAIEVAKGIDNPKHLLLKGVHPSPLSAKGGFFGSKPFSKINDFLLVNGREAIDWQLKEL